MLHACSDDISFIIISRIYGIHTRLSVRSNGLTCICVGSGGVMHIIALLLIDINICNEITLKCAHRFVYTYYSLSVRLDILSSLLLYLF